MRRTTPPREAKQGPSAPSLEDELETSVTRLLEDPAGPVSAESLDQVYALLYEDLRRIARSQIRKSRQRSEQFSPTSLVNETWLRLTRAGVSASNRSHVVSLAARAMRFILVDLARQQATEKHGFGVELLPLEAGLDQAATPTPERLLVIGQGLEQLERIDARAARTVELRYFGGLTDLEVAQLLGVNERTVRRDWRKARAYLSRQIDAVPSRGGDDAP